MTKMCLTPALHDHHACTHTICHVHSAHIFLAHGRRGIQQPTIHSTQCASKAHHTHDIATPRELSLYIYLAVHLFFQPFLPFVARTSSILQHEIFFRQIRVLDDCLIELLTTWHTPRRKTDPWATHPFFVSEWHAAVNVRTCS